MKTRELEEIINELNEKVLAIGIMQKFLVNEISMQSENARVNLQSSLHNFIDNLPKEYKESEYLMPKLEDYLEVLSGKKKKGPDLKLLKTQQDH